MMDNPSPVNLEEMVRTIATVDVMVFRFPIFEKRLLFDARWNSEAGPLLTLAPRVNSAQERFRNLQQLRPMFPLPANIIAFTWGRSAPSLKADGIWTAIEERARSSGHSGTDAMCRLVYAQLVELEHAERVAVLTGKGYRTIWERKKA